eukprot:11178298-Lingulodinium_polyedra.AAC.1
MIADPARAPGASNKIREAIASALCCQRAPWCLELEQIRDHICDFCSRSAGYRANSERQLQNTLRQQSSGVRAR